MNYYIIPATPQEVAEYERKEKEWMDAYMEKFEREIEKVIKKEFERVGLISKEVSIPCELTDACS